MGRGAELAHLEAAAARVLAGTAHLVLICGPAGIGKSALVREFLARQRGMDVRRGAADEAERALAYGLVDQLLDRPGELLLDGVPSDPLTVGGRLLHVLSQTGNRPLALVIDDLQWADEPSLTAIAFALRRLRRDPILTVLISRSDGTQHLSHALRRMAIDEGTSVRLDGLAAADLVALSRAVSGQPLDFLAAQRLHRHTEGNPLHALALLTKLGVDVLNATPQASLPAPSSYAELVVGWLAGCTAPARSLVEAAAVLSERCRLALASRIVDLTVPQGAFDEAAAKGLLVARGDGHDVGFPHPLVRVAVLQDLTVSRRAQLHRRAADVVDDERSAVLHRVSGHVGHDDALAQHAWDEGARWASRGEWVLAGQLYAAAERLTLDRQFRQRSTLERARCLLLAGDLAEAAVVIPEVTDLPASPERELVLGRLAMLSGASDEAITRLTAAWRSRRAGDDVTAAAIAGDLAHLAVNRGHGAETVRWARRAADPRHRPIVPDAYTLRCLGFGSLGQVTEALAELPEIPSHQADLSAAQLDALVGRGILELWSDQLGAACASLQRAERDLLRNGPLHLRLIALFYLADAEYRIGDWPSAVAHGQLAVSLARDAEQAWTYALVHSVAAFPLAAMGRWRTPLATAGTPVTLPVSWARTGSGRASPRLGWHKLAENTRPCWRPSSLALTCATWTASTNPASSRSRA